MDHNLHLDHKHKLAQTDILQIGPAVIPHINESNISHIFLKKLMMLDYKARYVQQQATPKEDHSKQEEDHRNDDISIDAFCSDSVENDQLKESTIHPLDVQMAVFHCSDSFLKQMMVTKLSQCQYALPLLVPDPFTEDIECPLWTFRHIQKTWKKTEDNSDVMTVKSMPICKAETPMVFCFRLGSLSVSKSQLINTLINDRHSTFFHRNCPGSTKTRLLFDGVAEIAWYCPAGKSNDTFPDCVAFCNLHGDGLTYDKQLKILMGKSSVNLVFVPTLRKDDASAQVISALLKSPKPLVVLFEDKGSAVVKLKKGKYKVGLKDRGQSDVSVELNRIIRDILSDPHDPFQLESVSDTGVRVDEREPCCTEGFAAAKEIMSAIKSVKVASIKSNLLPCQGKLWHDWCRLNKEQYRLKGHIEKDRSEKQNRLQVLRKAQCETPHSELMKSFIRHLSSLPPTQREYFLKWTQILMDTHSTEDLSLILQRYDEKWSELVCLKRKPDKTNEVNIKAKRAELEQISAKLQSTTCGLEHIFREMGQIYEAHKSLKKSPKNDQTDWSKYPELAAELMISGHPMELMDGDAGHVPLIWISSLIDQVIHKLGDKRVFVLSVLGIQSSGKSTMLNAMFGLQFAVSAGRCTRGAFMQLVKLSEDIRKDFKWDYILVVDTEGLRALELEGNATIHHDNELATFVVENPSEMQDVLQIVVQAFMRMKKVKLSPSCVFVHQNVTDVAAVEKNLDGKRKLQDKLDQMAQLAAKEEGSEAVGFSDIIEFDVQKDVKYFAQLWEGSPPMAPPNPGYSECVQDLKSFILSKASKSPGVTLSNFKTKVQDLWNALLNENFVFSFKNTLEITVYRKLEAQFEKWTWALRSEILNIENQLYTSIENGKLRKVEQTHIYTGINEKDKEILIQWKAQFKQRIKNFNDDLIRQVTRKLDELIQQKEACKKVDQQNNVFKSKLLQKSKDLARQLKDQAKDENALKELFECEWKVWVQDLIGNTKPIEDIDFDNDLPGILQELGIEWVQVEEALKSCKYKMIDKIGDYSSCILQTRQMICETKEKAMSILQTKPLSERGYNQMYVQEVAKSILDDVAEFQFTQKVSFKKEFIVDLVLYVLSDAKDYIVVSHRNFKVNHDAATFLQSREKEYYMIFRSFCKGSSSAVVLAKLICEQLKASMTEAVCNSTAISIAGEMRDNYPAFKETRLNLEKYVLKSLAEKEDFDSYVTYIRKPKKHLENFIKEEVKKYIFKTHKPKAVSLLQKNVDNISNQLNCALSDATEKVKDNANLKVWLEEFVGLIKNVLTFDTACCQEFDINNYEFLKEEIEKGLAPIVKEMKNLPLEKMNEFRLKPDQILIDQLTNCCWETCPYCGAVCTNTVKSHSPEKHSVPYHRPSGIIGWHGSGTVELVIDFCTTLVASDRKFYPQFDSDNTVPYKQYQTAGGNYEKWVITPAGSKLIYWKWFICRFQKELENYHNMKFVGQGDIPSDWRNYTKKEAIESLDEMYNM
uniref:VLIG-type G domain-containing protein n=1 Tax=Neogobius melanostomus TaxID=47308 RepID=A0A8C6SWH7_9GOBI